MFAIFEFNETSPTNSSSASSSQAVSGSDNTVPNGILASVGLDEFEMLAVIAEFAGNTGGTLDVYVQTLIGSRWYDFCHIKQTAAAQAMTRQQYVAGRATQTNGTLIGVDTTPLLANDTVVGGVWGDKFRLFMVSGSGTSAGTAVKVKILGQEMRNAKR